MANYNYGGPPEPYNPYAQAPAHGAPPEGRQPRRNPINQDPAGAPGPGPPNEPTYSHLAHASANYGGTYQPADQYQHQQEPYEGAQHHDDAWGPGGGGGYGSQDYVTESSAPADGMPLHTPTELYDPPIDPFQDEEPGIPLLSPRRSGGPHDGGMTAGGFNPNIVGMQGAGIGEEEGESLVRYGKIPQRQPRRYKTVKRAFHSLF